LEKLACGQCLYTVTYPANYTATSATEVNFEDVGATSTAELGAWNQLVAGQAYLTARVHGNYFYAIVNDGRVPTQFSGDYPGGFVRAPKKSPPIQIRTHSAPSFFLRFLHLAGPHFVVEGAVLLIAPP
jgi:hypothetical protein